MTENTPAEIAETPAVAPLAVSQPEQRAKSILERNTFLLILVVVSLLFALLLKPFFSPIFWACAVGILFHPLHVRLLQRWQRPNLAALAALTVCVLLVVIPALLILTSFFQEGTLLYQRMESGELSYQGFLELIQQRFPLLQMLVDRFHLDLEGLWQQLSSLAINSSRMLAQNALNIGQNMLQFVVSLMLMLYLAFFLLRDGTSLIDLMIRALPIGDQRERMLMGKIAEVTRATVKGNLIVAGVQGALGGIIFLFLGIPGPLLWGVVMTLLSLIPVVGASLIWGPVALYLIAVGEWVDGTILIVFGVAVIGIVDNILRPLLVGRDTKLPDFVVLLSTLGGFALFGMNGFVIGPLIAVLFVAFWEIFILEFNSPPVEGQAVAQERPHTAGSLNTVEDA